MSFATGQDPLWKRCYIGCLIFDISSLRTYYTIEIKKRKSFAVEILMEERFFVRQEKNERC